MRYMANFIYLVYCCASFNTKKLYTTGYSNRDVIHAYNIHVTVKVVSCCDWFVEQVHHDDEEPYYTVRVHATGRERQTDANHLVRPSSPQGNGGVDGDSAIGGGATNGKREDMADITGEDEGVESKQILG